MIKTLTSLQEYGLSETESLIYLNLLKVGSSSILGISRKTKLNRSTVHINVNSLISKGLATQLQKGKKRVIIAEPPERIQYILEQEKSQLKRKEEGLNNVITSIYEQIESVKENTNSQVKYYEGTKSVQRVYREILKSKHVKAYVSPAQIWEKLPENYYLFPEAMAKGLYVQDIVSRDKYYELFSNTYTNNPSIDFKLLPDDVKLESMDYLIYDNSIAIIQPIKDKNSISAIVIQNEGLYKNSSILFDLIWGILPANN